MGTANVYTVKFIREVDGDEYEQGTSEKCVRQLRDAQEDFESLAEAASMLHSIAEAMQADATRINRMANALLDGGESRWNYEGSYIQLAVENTEVQA